MKLYSVLELMNQNEKGRFVNILSSLISETDEQLTKKTDTEAFVGTFNTPKITAGYSEVVRRALRDDIKLDIAADIFMADGNGSMSRDSLAMKYKKKQEELKTSIKELEAYMDDEKNASNSRVRDYQIYAACLSTAAVNDMEHQAAGQISFDELTVINTLRHALELSDIEARALWLKYSNEDVDILVDDLITSLVSKGICFYKRSSMMIYIPIEHILSEDIFSAEDGARERKEKLADIIENRLKLKLEKQGRSLHEPRSV